MSREPVRNLRLQFRLAFEDPPLGTIVEVDHGRKFPVKKWGHYATGFMQRNIEWLISYKVSSVLGVKACPVDQIVSTTNDIPSGECRPVRLARSRA